MITILDSAPGSGNIAPLLASLVAAGRELQQIARPLLDVRAPLVVQGGSTLTAYLPELQRVTLWRVNSTGQTDYTDARYWIVPVDCTNATGDSTTDLAFTDVPTDDPRYQQVTATNLAEMDSGTHSVADGQVVAVLPVYDAQTPTICRYYFWMGGGPAPIRLGKPTGAYTSGATITLQPCDSAGENTVETAVLVQAGWTLPSGAEIGTDQIIPFQMAATDGLNYAIGNPRLVVCDMEIDGGSKQLAIKKLLDFGAFASTESAWITVHTGVGCTS